MSNNIHNDVKEALQQLKEILAVEGSVFDSVGCYDPALSATWAFSCPGGAYMLRYEDLDDYEGDLIYHTMRIMKDRGVSFGQFFVHLKCKYLFEVRGVTDTEGQAAEALRLQELVSYYNEVLGVEWSVVVQEGGSANVH